MENKMTPQLNPALLAKARRAPRRDGLTFEERMALNLFWRKDVRVPVLAKVFQCSKNTIYSNCLTGDAPSYPYGRAQEINDIIDAMGEQKAWDKYVTPGMVHAVDAANKEFIESRAA
jgi:hypothetical protein